jgi:peptidyl-prolyl cis-trans isomerase C
MMTHRLPFAFAALTLFVLTTAVRAQDDVPAGATRLAFPQDHTVATIDGEAVRMADVEAILQAAAQEQPNRSVPASAVAQALEAAIDQRLVKRYVLTATEGATPEQVNEALDRLKANLAQQGKSYEDVLAERKIDESTLREQINWQLSWGRYISQSLTDAALEACFARNRRDLDGSQLRASHILLRVDHPQDPAAMEGAIAEARQMKQEIAENKITFADAAKKYSEGPSRRVGGDLGFIGRNGPMVPAFNDVAFALEKGQTSEPTITPFGVHLIQVTDEKAGDKQWTDVQERLKQIVAQEMVEQIAKQQRENVKIEYTDDFPHFLPGTTDLAPLPGEPAAE